MRVCVTGANGFVGSKLCEALVEEKQQVIGLVRPTSDLQFLRPFERVQIEIGDITDRASLRPAFEGAEVVYHVAAFASDWGDWDYFRCVNIEGVRNVMEAAKAAGVKRVVHVSSVSVYGFAGGADIDERAEFVSRPEDPYVTTKQEGERVALSHNGNALEVVVIRPAGIYGPNDRTTSLKLLPELEKRKLPYVDGGRWLMGPIYIDNLVQAILLAGRSPRAPGQAYNIVDEGRTSWRQYFEWFCEDLECKKPALSAPSWVAFPLACVIEKTAKVMKLKDPPLTKYRIRAVMKDSHFCIDKAKEQLGYHPKVSTREGIRRTVEWFRAYQGKQQKGNEAR